MLFDGQGDWCAATFVSILFLLHLSTKIENSIFFFQLLENVLVINQTSLISGFWLSYILELDFT